jgi:CBS domain-containing protein
MNITITKFCVRLSLVSLTGSALAAGPDSPAAVLEWSFFVLLIFAGCVAAFVVMKTSKKRKAAPLANMLDEGRRPINSVHPDATVTEAVRLMHDENIGAVLVMEDDGLIGIFTERDALTNVLAAGIDPTSTKVSAVMTKDPFCIDPSTTVEEAMGIVTHRKIRHLPVVHNGELVGIVSSGDLTHWVVQDREIEIRELVDVAAHTRPR